MPTQSSMAGSWWMCGSGFGLITTRLGLGTPCDRKTRETGLSLDCSVELVITPINNHIYQLGLQSQTRGKFYCLYFDMV